MLRFFLNLRPKAVKKINFIYSKVIRIPVEVECRRVWIQEGKSGYERQYHGGGYFGGGDSYDLVEVSNVRKRYSHTEYIFHGTTKFVEENVTEDMPTTYKMKVPVRVQLCLHPSDGCRRTAEEDKTAVHLTSSTIASMPVLKKWWAEWCDGPFPKQSPGSF